MKYSPILIIILIIATIHAMASTPEQREQSASAAMAEAKRVYDAKSDEEKRVSFEKPYSQDSRQEIDL